MQSQIQPYVRNLRLFVQPGTQQLYKPNASLARRSINNIESLANTVAFYEAAPDAAGKRAILYLDGHVRRINESEWPQLRRASKVTVRLTGAAALYYVYRKRPKIPAGGTTPGTLYPSSSGRIYVRYPDGGFRWLAPPREPVEVPFETGRYLGLNKYQGYNGSTKGQKFGGYGASSTPNYAGAVPATV